MLLMLLLLLSSENMCDGYQNMRDNKQCNTNIDKQQTMCVGDWESYKRNYKYRQAQELDETVS